MSDIDPAIVALADQLRLDADNLRECAEPARLDLRGIADRMEWAATRIGGPRP